MPNQDTYWHEHIHNIMPELEIESYELHQEGLVNDVLIVNNEWVIRFTKTDWGKALMESEGQLMRYLQSRVSLSIPLPVSMLDGVLVYHHLKGEPFLRQIWVQAEEPQQQLIANQLGQFLRELHGVPTQDLDWDIPLTLAPVTRETWLDIHDRVIEKVYPLLLPHQCDWIESLFEPALSQVDYFDFEPVLIHGDLAPYHILYSPAERRLNAVIDFGVAGLGDPATDLGSLINCYGETLVAKIAAEYPAFNNFLPRARFYAQAIELQWVLLGLESEEWYWFTSHLGGARDIHEN